MRRVIFFFAFGLFFFILSPSLVRAAKMTPTPTVPFPFPNAMTERMTKRLGAATERMNQIFGRIDTRISLLTEEKKKTAPLVVGATQLRGQLDALDESYKKLASRSALFTSASSSSELRVFISDARSVNDSLQKIFANEKRLVGDLRRFIVPSATPSGKKV